MRVRAPYTYRQTAEESWFTPPAAVVERVGIPVRIVPDFNADEVFDELRAETVDLLLSFYFREMIGARVLALARLGAAPSSSTRCAARARAANAPPSGPPGCASSASSNPSLQRERSRQGRAAPAQVSPVGRTGSPTPSPCDAARAPARRRSSTPRSRTRRARQPSRALASRTTRGRSTQWREVV